MFGGNSYRGVQSEWVPNKRNQKQPPAHLKAVVKYCNSNNGDERYSAETVGTKLQ